MATTAGFFQTMYNFLEAVAEFLLLAFQWMLWLVADHGHRPTKAVWGVIGILIVFWGWFWLRLQIIGFEPKREKAASPQDDKAALPAASPWPLGFVFLFDRMIPLYKIREQHYSIMRYFRWASRSEVEQLRAAKQEPDYVRYFGRRFPAVPATADEQSTADSWLALLRIIGVILSVFLIAALNALVSR